MFYYLRFIIFTKIEVLKYTIFLETISHFYFVKNPKFNNKFPTPYKKKIIATIIININIKKERLTDILIKPNFFII